MAKTLTRWRPGAFAKFDFGDLFQLFAPEFRVEEFVTDGLYTLHAELPGVDPTKDVEVTVAGGMLKVRVERTAEKHEKAHSEFRYGTSVRTVTLPTAAVEDTATATYADGILEVTLKLSEPEENGGRRIPIGAPKPKAVKTKAAV